MADKLVKHVVLDSGAFIRNAPVMDIAEKVYTIAEVVKEIKDKATRQRLQVLPYELHFRVPPIEAIKTVTDFAKQTGDYRSLSAVDIKVMALVYQLEKENVGTDHIKLQPEKKVSWTSGKGQDKTSIAGFYVGKKLKGKVSEEDKVETEEEKDTLSENSSADVCDEIQRLTIDLETNSKAESSEDILLIDEVSAPCDQHVTDGSIVPETSLKESGSGDDEEWEDETDDDDDDNDGGEWITPGNIEAVRTAMGDKNMQKANVTVGCLTTDFAMQNVLIQMGLNVVSVNGMLIKRAKSYVFRCSGCFRITTDMTKEFCPNCGNKTLQRVAMTVDDDGTVQLSLTSRKPPSIRGLKYSLPRPQGGKHANNPILCADQKEAQQRASRANRVKYNVFDPDYIANTSPFAPVEVNSRSAQLGIWGRKTRQRRNPNENKKVYGRRK